MQMQKQMQKETTMQGSQLGNVSSCFGSPEVIGPGGPPHWISPRRRGTCSSTAGEAKSKSNFVRPITHFVLLSYLSILVMMSSSEGGPSKPLIRVPTVREMEIEGKIRPRSNHIGYQRATTVDPPPPSLSWRRAPRTKRSTEIPDMKPGSISSSYGASLIGRRNRKCAPVHTRDTGTLQAYILVLVFPPSDDHSVASPVFMSWMAWPLVLYSIKCVDQITSRRSLAIPDPALYNLPYPALHALGIFPGEAGSAAVGFDGKKMDEEKRAPRGG